MPFFQRPEGATVNGGTFVDINGSSNVINVGPEFRRGEGIKLLLNSYVQREAIHDSDARGTLGCHPGTRDEYIYNITSWGSGEWESEKRAFLMIGPAGAGKSAIARTCAHKVEAADKLGASFFFFRPSGWNDPKKFIPTIAYQLTTRYPAYHDFLDTLILGDHLVLEKTMDIQFRELIVKPLRKMSADGHSVGKDAVIIVDGLDECATVEAQVQIIRLIATSIREQTTPFLWAFFSRPEPPITSTFLSEIATSISWSLPLTLSGNAESDIEAYLRGSFQMIRAKHSIPAEVAWPAEEDICYLVSQSAGLFVYAVTAIRYIDGLSNGKSGLEERLSAVLELNSSSTESPFFALDQLYTLVMMQIPQGVLPNTLSLLRLDQSDLPKPTHHRRTAFESDPDDKPLNVHSYCLALGFSPTAFHVAISNLYSVLEVTKSRMGLLMEFQFYHKSFLDFLLDPRRSRQYFIKSPGVHQHCLEMIARTMASAVDTGAVKQYAVGHFTLQTFFRLVNELDGKLEENILQQLSQVNWSLWHGLHHDQYLIGFTVFIQKIPKDWRPGIIRPSRRRPADIPLQILAMLKPGRYEARNYTLGKGDKKCLITRISDGLWHIA